MAINWWIIYNPNYYTYYTCVYIYIHFTVYSSHMMAAEDFICTNICNVQ